MGKSGYTSLSLDEVRYKSLRKNWNQIVSTKTDDTFTAWSTTVLEQSIERIKLINEIYPNFTWIGKTDNGCVIKDKNTIVEIKWSKNRLVCSIDSEGCKHCEYAALNPQF